MTRARAVARFALRLAVGAALLALVLHRQGAALADVSARLRQMPPWAFALAFAVDLAGQSLCAVRWAALLSMTGPAPLRAVWATQLRGMFFSVCLPTSIGGDVYRGFAAARPPRTASDAATSVLLDRDLGLGPLLVVGIGTALASGTSIALRVAGRAVEVPAWSPLAAVLVAYLAVNAALFGPPVSLPRALARVEALRASFRRFREPDARGALLRAVAISVTYQLSEGVLVFSLAKGLGLASSYAAVFTFMALQAVAGVLPLSINNLGVREAVAVAVLARGGGGASASEAVALSLAWLGVILTTGAASGLVYLLGPAPLDGKQRSITGRHAQSA